ncbi:SapC family protein [Catenovulum maritimum]|uniref:Multidrug transporter n=1 Tax=Catenovulum maritimum TaxID=1513271 RepID=A0A0J8JIH2_9ALTE|nr:SapC family protein [Catenovulum maritimum]KMT64256.1 hypothetical protein XM47_15390 [Catenovulum maritimum]
MTDKNIQIVNFQLHSDLCIDTKNYEAAENKMNTAYIVATEISTLCHEYPIFIIKNPDNGLFQLCALLGLNSGENLYLDNGQWRAKYLPLDVLRRPFQLALPEGSMDNQGQVAINMDSPQVCVGKGEAVFTEEGEPTAYFKRIQQSFSQLMGGTKFTSSLLKQADDLGLLEQVTLDYESSSKGKQSLNGLYSFSQEAVSKLAGESLEQCHKSGILQVCYLMQTSGIHLQKLVEWNEKL